MEKQNIWTTLYSSAKQNKKQLIKMISGILGVELVLFAMGISFALIADGLLMAVIYLALYIQPFQNWLIRIFHIANPQWQQMPPMNLHRWIIVVWRMTFSLLIIILGMLFLHDQGFLGQNIIYQLLK